MVWWQVRGIRALLLRSVDARVRYQAQRCREIRAAKAVGYFGRNEPERLDEGTEARAGLRQRLQRRRLGRGSREVLQPHRIAR